MVIESPVPVLLDVYADWCGPCKQLGPMLEEMAVRSGGMFRLAKVNSDKNRGVSDVLQVRVCGVLGVGSQSCLTHGYGATPTIPAID